MAGQITTATAGLTGIRFMGNPVFTENLEAKPDPRSGDSGQSRAHTGWVLKRLRNVSGERMMARVLCWEPIAGREGPLAAMCSEHVKQNHSTVSG
jgi:hypothetical protein